MEISGKEPRYPLNRRTLQEEKNLLPLLAFEPRTAQPEA
jgi:hypothetical protein